MHRSPRVKICGNRDFRDLTRASRAHACGFIVDTPESSRNLSPSKAEELIRRLPPFCSSVLVTVNTSPRRLARLSSELQPDCLQVHAPLEPPELREISGRIPSHVYLIGLIPVSDNEIQTTERAEGLKSSAADAVILDTASGSNSGGTGRPHDWSVSRAVRKTLEPVPTVLAGGLNPSNVAEAVRTVQPYAVDVATGVETEAGAKSPEKIQQFLRRVRDHHADQ